MHLNLMKKFRSKFHELRSILMMEEIHDVLYEIKYHNPDRTFDPKTWHDSEDLTSAFRDAIEGCSTLNADLLCSRAENVEIENQRLTQVIEFVHSIMN